MEKYKPGVGLSAGSLMIKWGVLDSYIHRTDKIVPGSNVNLFINFETVLRNLAMTYNTIQMIEFFRQDVVLEIESSVLNLIAMYKGYFNKERCDVRIFLYYTDLNFETQMMREFNKYYRSFYRNKYCQNQKYKSIGELMTEVIVPELKMILQYVPDCYFLESKTFDSSIIPLVIAEEDHTRHNVIISSDVFDSLYLFEERFITLYIKRRFANYSIISDIEAAVQSIVTGEDIFQLSTLYQEMYYKLLLSIKGSKIRNIQSAKGFGYMKFVRILNEGVSNNTILTDFKAIDSIIDLFPEKYREDIRIAYRCTDIRFQYSLLTDADKESILNQIIDLHDISSIENLNNVRFRNYQINIKGLLQ